MDVMCYIMDTSTIWNTTEGCHGYEINMNKSTEMQPREPVLSTKSPENIPAKADCSKLYPYPYNVPPYSTES